MYSVVRFDNSLKHWFDKHVSQSIHVPSLSYPETLTTHLSLGHHVETAILLHAPKMQIWSRRYSKIRISIICIRVVYSHWRSCFSGTAGARTWRCKCSYPSLYMYQVSYSTVHSSHRLFLHSVAINALRENHMKSFAWYSAKIIDAACIYSDQS